MQANVEAFFDPVTGTVSYVVHDVAGGHAAIIDPVLDYDPRAGRTRTQSVERLLAFVQDQRLTVDWILETHAHADHISAAAAIKQRVGGRIAIGEHIRQVQQVFKALFHLEPEFKADGAPFDTLFADNETFMIGALTGRVLFVPGHTPADIAYQIGDAVFVGDTLFMPDVGTARCDFPGGDARQLYRSVRRLLDLPPHTRLYMCHDYPPPGGRAPRWLSTVEEQRASNIHVHDGVDEESFARVREARDRTLEAPVLLLPSVQMNIRAGQLPPAESNGVHYLKIPLNAI